MFSYASLATDLGIEMAELNQGLRNLENYGLLDTIRSGQYFIRKYLTKDWDIHFGQKYDDFEI
jgi:DNA-binding transcriptional regulator YhcF (GntR family)